MSNLVEIKKRIESISSTIKVTKVMQMIATAKIAKIKTKMSSVEKHDKYANDILSYYLKNTINKLEFNKYIDGNEGKQNIKHILFILFASDKGTCGSINTNVFKEVRLLLNNYSNSVVSVLPIGKKAVKFCDAYSLKYGFKVFQQDQRIDAEYCDSKIVNNVVSQVISSFEKKEFDEIHVLYHKFKNIITCNVVNEKLIPFNLDSITNKTNNDCDADRFINIIESEYTASAIIEFFVRTKIYNAYISNIASIVSSRMNAMDNATKNGQVIIDELKIKYNKGRQANITSELSDIVSGFETIS